MPDREKVINGLECCKRKDGNECKVCPYTESEYCVEDMVTDALALLNDYDTQLQYRDDHIAEYEKEIKRLEGLLKEQENASKRNPVIVCPHCGKRVK